MSSQEDDSGATLGPEENEQGRHPFPGSTWVGPEDQQGQQPDPTSTPQTPDYQDNADTTPVTANQKPGKQDVAGTTLASTPQTTGDQSVANLPLASTPQASGNQGVANPPSPGGGGPPPSPGGPPPPPPSFWQRFDFVLVPLVFAILIFFFTILFANRNHVFLPPLALAMLLLALGVMQGTLLYYIDKSKNQASQEMYWHLTVIVGFALFLVVGTLAIFGFGASIFFIILLLLGSFFVVPRAIHQVPEGSIDFMTLFSKHVRTLQPGPHVVLWPLEKSKRLSTKEENWEDPLLKVQIKRDKNGEEYDFHLRAKLKYQLDPDPDKAQKAKLKVENWEKSVQKEFVTVLKNVFKEVTPEEVNSWRQGAQAQPAGATSTTGSTPGKTLKEITNTIKDLVQQEVDDWGVKVHKVDIQDLTLIHIVTSRPSPTRPVTGALVGPGSTGAQHTSSTNLPPVDKIPTTPIYPIPDYPPYSETEIELLEDWYEAVRLGNVTDPDTIRMLAARFAEHGYDPNLNFYPLRAAEILYSRARYNEEMKDAKSRTTGTVPVQKPNSGGVVKGKKNRKTFSFLRLKL